MWPGQTMGICRPCWEGVGATVAMVSGERRGVLICLA